jgi:hypothetical protein
VAKGCWIAFFTIGVSISLDVPSQRSGSTGQNDQAGDDENAPAAGSPTVCIRVESIKSNPDG